MTGKGFAQYFPAFLVSINLVRSLFSLVSFFGG